MAPTPSTVLVIAGSDPSGGAGLEADQRVLAVHGCYALTATTALTAQNTRGVRDVHITPPEFLRKQLEAVFEDVVVDVVKIGMLASRECVEVVADVLGRWQGRQREENRKGWVVLDPVRLCDYWWRMD
jgi:hydroxymethylpyrimidine kinase/phosphomethylpyrimidine kinase